jgi:hypothetical protein
MMKRTRAFSADVALDQAAAKINASVTRLHFQRSVDLLDLGQELQTVAAQLNIAGRRIVIMNEAPAEEQVNQIGELAIRILVAAGSLRKLQR